MDATPTPPTRLQRLQRLAFGVTAGLVIVAGAMWVFAWIWLEGWRDTPSLRAELGFWIAYLWLVDWLLNVAIATAVVTFVLMAINTSRNPPKGPF